MGRRLRGIILLALLLVATLTVANLGFSYSDGTAGMSGAIAENQRDCIGVEYCRVVPSYCGGCHGGYDDMKEQEGSNPTPQERVNQLTFAMNGDDNAGSPSGKWEYVPNEEFTIDIRLPDARPMGKYNSGGFNLNASGGALSVLSGDATVRITGGLFEHQGTKNPEVALANGRKYGNHIEDESKWAGEATHTAKGAEVRVWRVHYRAPPVQTPHGVALVMTAMLPNGNGVDQDCTSEECGLAQAEWDWYGFMIPRRILCERGFFPTFGACQKAVTDFILPPPPPPNTECPPNTGCPTPSDPTRGTPAADFLTAVAMFGFAGWTLRRRR